MRAGAAGLNDVGLKSVEAIAAISGGAGVSHGGIGRRDDCENERKYSDWYRHDLGSKPNASGVRVGRVRVEQLLAADLVAGDDVLTFRRNQEVDELLTEVFLDARIFRRIHQHHAILVEQALVAFDHDGEIAAVLESEPSAAIRQHVSVDAMHWPNSYTSACFRG